MESKKIILFIAAGLFNAVLSIFADQPLPPPPAGFKVAAVDPSAQALKDTGQGDIITAEKVSDSRCDAGSRTRFTYGWQVPLVGFDKTWEVWKKTPEEPASRVNGMGISEEPAGKRLYKDGILAWRKVTRAMPVCADKAVTYRGSWMSYVSGKLVVLSVENVGSKDTGQAWIDEYIGKVVAAAASAPIKPRTPNSLEPYLPEGFVVDDEKTVTQYLSAYNVTRVSAYRVNKLPKPFVSPENSSLDLVYLEIVEPSYAPKMRRQAQEEAEKESQDQTDSERKFIGKETITGGGTIYWYQKDPLQYLPRRLRSTAGAKPLPAIYDGTIILQLDKGFLTIKITDFVGEREALRKWYARK